MLSWSLLDVLYPSGITKCDFAISYLQQIINNRLLSYSIDDKSNFPLAMGNNLGGTMGN